MQAAQVSPITGDPFLVEVAKSGDDFTSIQTAIDSILDAGPDHPYLVWIAPGRKWRLQPDTPRFFEMDPLFQLGFLLYVWWFQVNWLVAVPYGGIGEELPQSLEQITLAHLRAIRPQSEVPFVEFADRLVAAAGLTWTAPDMTYAADSLRNVVRRMVFGVLERFGAVKCTYRENPLYRKLQDLVAFEITPLGVALLDSLLIQEG